MDIKYFYMFGFGFLGSVAVEVASLLRTLIRTGRVTKKYRTFGYLIARIFLAIIGGVLAALYYDDLKADNYFFAVHVGASAPAFFYYLKSV